MIHTNNIIVYISMINLREFYFRTLSFFIPKILKIFQFPVTTPLPPRYSSERRYLPWDLTIVPNPVSDALSKGLTLFETFFHLTLPELLINI